MGEEELGKEEERMGREANLGMGEERKRQTRRQKAKDAKSKGKLSNGLKLGEG
jgi:hypothetical protein